MAHAAHILSPILAISMAGSLAVVATVSAAAQDETVNETSIVEILQNTDQYLQQEVNVTGEVDDILSLRTFALSSDEADGRLLVAGAPNVLPTGVEDGVTVDVTGTVRIFAPDDSLDWSQDIGLNPASETYADFEDAPVVVANSISVTEEGNEEGDDEFAPTSLVDVIGNADEFVGDQISVIGEVETVPAADGFTINADQADDDLLVRAPEPAISGEVSEDAIVRVNGTVRVFNPGGDWAGDLNINTENEVFTPYEEDPILVTDSIEVLVPALGEEVEDILGDPDAFVDSEVDVIGEVDELLAARAFTLNGTEGFLGFGENNLLVVGEEEAFAEQRPLAEDAIVQVQGTVQIVDPDNPGEWSGNIDAGLEEEIFNGFADEPLIVADSVTVLSTERGERIEDILDRPGNFVGKSVSVAGNVSERLNEQAFSLEGMEALFGVSDRDLLVIGGEGVIPADQLDDDVIVVAEGTVRILDPDESGEWSEDIGIDLEDEAFDDFEGDPVLIVTSVNPIAVE